MGFALIPFVPSVGMASQEACIADQEQVVCKEIRSVLR